MRVSRIIWPILAVALIAGAGCRERPVMTQPAPSDTASPSIGDAPGFIVDLRTQLAEQLNLSIEEVRLVTAESVDWPDACLGAGRPNEMCLQVITPGFKLVFSVPQGELEVHTDRTGETYRIVQPDRSQTQEAAQMVLTWERSGGIAGICENLVVESDGSYRLGRDCAGAQVLSGVVPARALMLIMQWTTEYRSFTWESSPPAGSADMFMDRLVLTGQGTVSASEDEQSGIAGTVSRLVEDLLADSLPPVNQADSGIEGTIVIGPTCPVIVAENPCPDRPYQATMTVRSSDGSLVTRFTSAADGTFRVSLPPGSYLLEGESSGTYPRPPKLEVAVEAGQYTSVDLMYDTGIR